MIVVHNQAGFGNFPVRCFGNAWKYLGWSSRRGFRKLDLGLNALTSGIYGATLLRLGASGFFWLRGIRA